MVSKYHFIRDIIKHITQEVYKPHTCIQSCISNREGMYCFVDLRHLKLVPRDFETQSEKNSNYHCCKSLHELSSKQKRLCTSLQSKLLSYSKNTECTDKVESFIRFLDIDNGEIIHQNMWNEIVEFFSEFSDKDAIHLVKSICHFHVVTEECCLLCIAQETWANGYIEDSFKLFTGLYRNGNANCKENVLKTLQWLVHYSIKKKGKALIGVVMESVQTFCKDDNEVRLLITLWYSLYISDWYEDRCLADELLASNYELKKSLTVIIPQIGFCFLIKNEVVNCQRLIETSLRYNMSASTRILLHALFDHYYKRGYIMGCSTVHKCCTDLNLKLTRDQLYKYNMLRQSSTKPKNVFQIHVPEEIKFRF